MRWVLLAVLVLAGSCAPERRPLVSQVVPERPSTLLRKLALDVPDDVARLPLVVTGGAEQAARITAAPAFIDTARSIDDADRARDCLTAAIYYEARSEPVDGQRAVAQVVLNRVRDRAFPASVCGVVYQGSNRRTGCQFSFTCDGSMNRQRNPESWARAGMVAVAALAGDVYAPVGSATHYHTTAISPWWAPSLTRLTTVGAHIFYRWPSAMERALTFRQSYAGYEPSVSAGGGGSIASDVIAAFGVEQAHGVTIHRGVAAADDIAPVPDDGTARMQPAASSVTVAGVRVHHGLDFSSRESGGVRIHRASEAGQASASPTPIEARAASASLDTTG